RRRHTRWPRDWSSDVCSSDLPLDELRRHYSFDVSCQGTVPPALVAFLDSKDYEDAVRKAVSLGGDSDTLACITGGIAQAFYGSRSEERRVGNGGKRRRWRSPC